MFSKKFLVLLLSSIYNVYMRKIEKILILLSLGIVDFLGAIDMTGLIISLPKISADLGLDVVTAQWIINAFTLALVSSMIIFGKIGDRIGVKKLYMVGLLIFSISSLALGVTSNFYVIVALRLIQGFGTAILYSMSFAIISHLWKNKEKAFSVTASLFAVGMLVGPLISGLFLLLNYGSFQGWHFFFLMNVPFAIGGIIIGRKYIPALAPSSKEPVNFLNALLLFCFFLFGMLFLIYGGILFSVLSIISLVFLVIVENTWRVKTFDHPIFKHKNFIAANIISFLVTTASLGIAFALSFHFQDNLHWNSVKTSLAVLPVPLATILFAMISTNIRNKKLGAFLSSLLLLIGIIYLWAFAESGSYFEHYFIPLLMIGAAAGILMTSVFATILDESGQESYGFASGILSTIQELGGLVGVVLVSTRVTNLTSTFSVMLVCAVISIVISLFITNKPKAKNA